MYLEEWASWPGSLRCRVSRKTAVMSGSEDLGPWAGRGRGEGMQAGAPRVGGRHAPRGDLPVRAGGPPRGICERSERIHLG